MFDFVTLQCYSCNSVIISLPRSEASKLEGLTFQCECCGHQNLLNQYKFHAANNSDPFINTLSFENLALI